MELVNRQTLPVGPDAQGAALIVRPSHHEGCVVATVWVRESASLGGWLMVAQRTLDASRPPGDDERWDQILQSLYNAGGKVSERSCCPF